MSDAVRFNLYYTLEHTESRRALIADMAREFDRLYETVKDTYSPSLLYGESAPAPEPVDKDVRAPTSSAADLTTILSHMNDEPDYISLDFNYNFIKDEFNKLLTTYNHPLIEMWVVLFMYYVSPELCQKVQEFTEPSIGIPFFHDYVANFDMRLAGIPLRKEDRTNDTSNVDVASQTPLEITINKLLHLNRIRSTKPMEEGDPMIT